MHDIICPNCGERFLGYDVAFDMSEYILPLLYSNRDEEDAVRQVKFKYYVDEETILHSNTEAPARLLECTGLGGPGLTDQTFPFLVNGKMLLEYVLSKADADVKQSELLTVFSEIRESVEANDFSVVTPLHLAQLSMLYHLLFDVSDTLVGEISIDDEHVRTAIKILVHIYALAMEDASNTLTLSVCIYSSHLNGIPGYHVPDLLFIKHSGMFERIGKCCRFCGKPLPDEFGYYKMKPVVLLGSHAAGKTSYLLSLLDTVLTQTPFIDDQAVATSTLNNDFNLTAFMNNIARFRQGLAPNKTDFQNVPILNLKVRDTIYSFIDWPGEKFISGAETDQDYVYKSKRVITHAKHVFFFLPPEQIDVTLPSAEENVTFDIMELGRSLTWHMSFPNQKRMRSLTYISNKIDKLRDRPNAAGLFETIEGKTEVDVFSASNWKQNEFDVINNGMKNYIMLQNPALYGMLEKLSIGNVVPLKRYIPTAPYGYDAEKQKDEKDGENTFVVHRRMLAGLPFLGILRADSAI